MYILNLLLNNTLAQTGFQLPPGQPLTLQRIYSQFLEPLANFLIAAGVVLAIITLVIAGINYFRTPSEAQAKLALSWFKNGLIGAIIILGVGVIINTIALVVTGGFFGGVPGGPGSGPGGPISGGPGSPCVNNSQCISGTTCDVIASGICVRDTGNLEGEICKGDGDCAPNLRCKGGIFGTGQKTCKQP